MAELIAAARTASRLSIMTLPTKKHRAAGTPSRSRFAMPAGSETNRTSLIASVNLRLTSSGISSSKLRRPASTWIISGRRRTPRLVANGRARTNFEATSAQAIVGLTSPTTSTAWGCSSRSTGSNRRMISAVCAAWLPEPTSSSKSGRGMPSSSKNTWDSFAS